MSIDPTTALWLELQLRAARSATPRADKRDARGRRRRRAK
jgi:hypothetical protein